MHKLQNVTIKRDDTSWEIVIDATIGAEDMQRYFDRAANEYQKNITIDGFRPGKAPLQHVIEKVGEQSVLHAAAEDAVHQELPNLLASEKLLIIEAPRVSIDTPKKGGALHFSARAPRAPEVKLPDYKSIAATIRDGKKEPEVSETEVKDTLMHLRRERARIEKSESGTVPADAAVYARDLKEEDLPALDDDFVKTLGYSDAASFEKTVRENIKTEKELRLASEMRASLLEKLVKESSISYPSVLKEYELDDMQSQFESDVSRAGLTMEGYFKETKKTLEEVRKGWIEAADKRVKIRLLLSEIARKENIEADHDALEHELVHAKEHHKTVSDDILRSHISHMMRNEKTMRFLESGTIEPLPTHNHEHHH